MLVADREQLQLAAQEMTDQDLARAIRDRLDEIDILMTEARQWKRRLSVEIVRDPPKSLSLTLNIMKRL
jgi:hypothetical protein